MRVGIMGGTFDPLHCGHLIAAESARVHALLDEVWFIPARIPPHKEHPPLANDEQRWEMLCLGIQGNEYFKANDIELRQSGVSYTLHTAKLLEEQYPAHEFYYIIGADMVQYLPHWHRIDELLDLITFIGLERAGTSLQWGALSGKMRSKVKMVPMPSIEISSTMIRNRCAEQLSIRYLVPEDVHNYIKEYKLYESH